MGADVGGIGLKWGVGVLGGRGKNIPATTPSIVVQSIVFLFRQFEKSGLIAVQKQQRTLLSLAGSHINLHNCIPVIVIVIVIVSIATYTKTVIWH